MPRTARPAQLNRSRAARGYHRRHHQQCAGDGSRAGHRSSWGVAASRPARSGAPAPAPQIDRIGAQRRLDRPHRRTRVERVTRGPRVVRSAVLTSHRSHRPLNRSTDFSIEVRLLIEAPTSQSKCRLLNRSTDLVNRSTDLSIEAPTSQSKCRLLNRSADSHRSTDLSIEVPTSQSKHRLLNRSRGLLIEAPTSQSKHRLLSVPPRPFPRPPAGDPRPSSFFFSSRRPSIARALRGAVGRRESADFVERVFAARPTA